MGVAMRMRAGKNVRTRKFKGSAELCATPKATHPVGTLAKPTSVTFAPLNPTPLFLPVYVVVDVASDDGGPYRPWMCRVGHIDGDGLACTGVDEHQPGARQADGAVPPGRGTVDNDDQEIDSLSGREACLAGQNETCKRGQISFPM